MIKFITVGKVKNSDIKSLIGYYLKQIPRKIEQIELKDEPNIDGIEKEGEQILKKIKSDDFLITLEIKGEALTSEGFAKLLDNIELKTKGNIVFVIGGSYGLSEEVSKRSNYKLSFSKMTFPHQLMQIFLAEQVFRAYSILQNHPYHK